MYDFKTYKSSDGPHKFFTLSFDDGVTQDRRFVEIINKYGLKCTFNLNSGTLGRIDKLENAEFSVDHNKVQPEEIRTLYDGHEIAVHTVTHPRLDMLSQDDVFHQVEDDRIKLEELSGQKIFGMAYPGGPFFNDEVINTIVTRTPIRYSRATDATRIFTLPERLMVWQPTCHMLDEHFPELLEKFIALEPEEDVLLYVWGHTYEFDIYDAWEKVDGYCRRASGHDDICYATNGEIADYLIKKAQ